MQEKVADTGAGLNEILPSGVLRLASIGYSSNSSSNEPLHS